MAASSGIDGKVEIGTNTVLNISEWSLDIKHNVQDKTSFTETWETKLAGLRGATGSVKGLFNAADTNGQAALLSAALNGTSVALDLFYTDSAYYVIEACFIDGVKCSNKVDGTVEAEFTFIVNGAVTTA